MKRLDDSPIDPQIEAYLDAVDATLAGEPVDPRQAEVAELALMLAGERPRPSESFARRLDVRVQRRFAPDAVGTGRPGPRPARPRWHWTLLSTGGVAAAAMAAVIAVVVITSAGGGSRAQLDAHAVSGAAATAAAASSPGTRAPGHKSPAGSLSASGSGSTSSSASSSGLDGSSGSASASGAANQSLAPAPVLQGSVSLPPNGRKVIQSAELDLAAAPDRIDAVAQEVFNVVGAARGIVDHSQVTQTGGLDGTASFQLRLPSGTLGDTLARLSKLQGAQVVSRTDNSQDVNSQYVSTQRDLADAQALHTALLKQLAGAVTTGQIDSLQARIHDAENRISNDQATLRSLDSQINYSQVTVTISARSVPAPVSHGGTFTLGHAAHVAGRVLVVAAGVALIVLAALVPVGLVGALAAWIAVAVRRRRREQALDLA